MRQYIALIEGCGTNYSVVFPDVPGVITTGDTHEEAVKNAHEALSLHLEATEDLPLARTLKQIKEAWEDWQEWQRDGDFTVAYIDLLPRRFAEAKGVEPVEGLTSSLVRGSSVIG